MYPTYEWILSKPLYKHTLTDGRTEKATYSGTSSALPKNLEHKVLQWFLLRALIISKSVGKDLTNEDNLKNCPPP